MSWFNWDYFEDAKEKCNDTDTINVIIETKCHDCGKNIKIELPKIYAKRYVGTSNCFTCNSCVPKNSPARNDIEESFFTEYEGGRL